MYLKDIVLGVGTNASKPFVLYDGATLAQCLVMADIFKSLPAERNGF